MGYFETMSGRDMQIEAKVLKNSKFEFFMIFCSAYWEAKLDGNHNKLISFVDCD